MRSADAAVFAGRKTENVGDTLQKFVLAGMQNAVGRRDLEQAVENVFQHRGIARKDTRDLSGIALVTGCVAAGEIEEAPHMRLLVRRHAEDAIEGFDFFVTHHAVGLRHLGGERDHRDGEGDAGLAARRLFVAVDQEMARQHAHGRADGTADQKARCRSADFSPNGHGSKLKGKLGGNST